MKLRRKAITREGDGTAYIEGMLQVTDIEAYRREYGRRVIAQLAAAGGRLLVAEKTPTVLEGDWQPTATFHGSMVD